MLHWANKDQYYTKSGENFSNYAFTLENGKKVQFRLVEADTAKENRKDNDQTRVFALIEPKIKRIFYRLILKAIYLLFVLNTKQ